ncbi:MAG: glycine--tRNA ligase [Patescibacteria group bacterium]|nr:glycine--tRNA ligase [Patescibacteria group bacterium]
MGNLTALAPLVELAKKRGIIFQSSEIYGGASGVYDFGPIGVEIKNNLKRFFWKRFIHLPDNMVGIDAGILMQRAVWQASGHEMNFVDLMVECKKCHQRFRHDDEEIKNNTCPICKSTDLTLPQKFNAMFKTFFGPLEDSGHQTFLRPETAQGMFVNFKNVLDTTRQKLPFGMGQIGKAFRNEITTKNFIFRSREFEQGEIEFFIEPSEPEGEKWFDWWLQEWQQFFLDLGLSPKNLRFRPHKKSELAHYSRATVDIEYKFPFGWAELAGVANRTDFDLKRHSQVSGKDLTYFDETKKEKYYPWVIEPTMGIDRTVLAILCESYSEYPHGRSGKGEKEIVLDINPKIAAFKAAVFPLTKDEKLVKVAEKIVAELKEKSGNVFYDITGSIGRRYRRQDEIGTPFCITVDFESLDDKKVTIRDISTMEQERVAIKDLNKWLEPKTRI